MSELQTVEADVKKVYSFGRAHLVLAGLLLVAILGIVHLIDVRAADRADAKYATAVAVAAEKDKANAALQQQNAQLEVELAKNEAQQQATAAMLIEAAKAIQTATQKQVAKVPTETPTQLSVQWGQLANEPAPPVDSNNLFQVPLPLAQKSVESLIQVPGLIQENAKLTDANTALSGAVTDADKQLVAEKSSHVSDDNTCAVDKKALNDEIVKVKADSRKRSLKYMLLGGFIVEGIRIYLTHSL